MIIIDKETTDFVKLINLMLPEHGDIALLDDEVDLKGETRFMAGDDDTYRQYTTLKSRMRWELFCP